MKSKFIFFLDNDSEITPRELLRLIEVGASCFNHHCVGYDDTQPHVLHSVHRLWIWAVPALSYVHAFSSGLFI